jgi:glutamate dehydrogenase
VSSLLDITDNLKGDKTIPPANVVRWDGDDPYLVVAADKGTATFSDIANQISAEHGFWLDDAFASGGSAGYDHKKMGITARGAWEAVKRHFREIDIDIQSTPFTTLGVGDMSGDVFGNGALLSRQMKLIAAFDHRDILIDPNPDPERSFAERQRLFLLPRSSWQDYDKTLISAGGGLFSRQLKSIPVSEQMRTMTGLTAAAVTPHQLIHALLKSEVDLLWLGGIGTYVKATEESASDVGDRANDALRINAADLKAKVVGEGANLGVTQKGRVEFARRGGRINTDAIDNSAGVNSSDMEVNIKIPLGAAEQAGTISREQRNELLAGMTDDVAALVLRNNYMQTLSLSLAVARGTEETGYAILLMHQLEKRGLLDREIEGLPTDQEIKARDARREGLTRPEFAVLLAYAKIALHQDLLESNVPDDEYLSRELERYFPQKIIQRHGGEIRQHRLKREIVARMLSNSMINRGGPGFVARLQSESGATAAQIAAAFAVARDSFDFTAHNTAIDALDNRIASSLQIKLYLDLQSQLRRATQWFLRNTNLNLGINDVVSRFRQGIGELKNTLHEILPAVARQTLRKHEKELEAGGVPGELARRIAGLAYLQRAPDIVQVAKETSCSLAVAARVLYASGLRFHIDELTERALDLVARDLFERLAINRTMDQILLSHRTVTRQVLAYNQGDGDSWQAWSDANEERISVVTKTIEELLAEAPFDLAKLSVAQGLLSDLAMARG